MLPGRCSTVLLTLHIVTLIKERPMSGVPSASQGSTHEVVFEKAVHNGLRCSVAFACSPKVSHPRKNFSLRLLAYTAWKPPGFHDTQQEFEEWNLQPSSQQTAEGSRAVGIRKKAFWRSIKASLLHVGVYFLYAQRPFAAVSRNVNFCFYFLTPYETTLHIQRRPPSSAWLVCSPWRQSFVLIKSDQKMRTVTNFEPERGFSISRKKASIMNYIAMKLHYH